MIVLILGWKNGVLVGATSGVTIGVTLGIITGGEPIIIAAYAISGMIAGILNRFGKIGVVIGFALGNVVLAYVSNGYTVELIHFKEILIASIGLLAVPKNLQIDLEEFIGNSKFLPSTSGRALNKSKEVAESLNNVSKAIDKIAVTYRNEEVSEKGRVSETMTLLTMAQREELFNKKCAILGKYRSALVDDFDRYRRSLVKLHAEREEYGKQMYNSGISKGRSDGEKEKESELMPLLEESNGRIRKLRLKLVLSIVIEVITAGVLLGSII